MATRPAIATKGYHRGRTPANKGRKFPPQVPTPDEVRALLRACSDRAPTGIRNKALIVVLYRAGLRCAEALSLLPRDVDPGQGSISVQHGKGGRSRIVGLDPAAMSLLLRWVDRRKALGIDGRRCLFCTLEGRPLKPSYVRTLLPRLAVKAGVEKRVHPHALRHAHAAELTWEGVPLPLIQRQLGHASLATTDRYLRSIAPADVVRTMQARVWEP